MRDLPRQLTEGELAELFEGRTRLVEVLATREDPLGTAEEAIAELDEQAVDGLTHLIRMEIPELSVQEN